jgi:hypothetical protein
MNHTLDLYSSVDSSDTHRLSSSEFIPSHRVNRQLHQSLDMHPIQVKDMRKSNQLFYRVPNNDYMWKKGPNVKLSRAKISSYLDDHANSLKHVPCATKYSKMGVWGQRYTGKFQRTKKISMSEHYMEKSNDTPASNQYKITVKRKIPGSYKFSTDKTSHIDSHTEDKKIIPSPDRYTINLKQIKLRSRIAKFYPIKKERFEKLKKDSSPGPTTYETPDCIRKTKWSPPHGSVSLKANKGNLLYFDQYLKRKKAIPGVGNYKGVEKAFDLSVRYRSRGRF